MKTRITIDIDYHPDTAALTHTSQILSLIPNVYGVRTAEITNVEPQ